MRKLIQWMKEEMMRVIPAIIYFVISFNLINYSERLMLHLDTPPLSSYLTATIGALLAGKFLIIVNTFPFVNAFPKKPIIYNIIWQFFLYSILTLLFRILEVSIDFSFHHHDTFTLFSYLQMRLTTPAFWAIQIWLVMLFFGYIVASELTRVLGKEKIKKIFMG